MRAWFGTNSRQSRMTSGVHASSALCAAKPGVAVEYATRPRSKPATIIEDGKNRFKRKRFIINTPRALSMRGRDISAFAAFGKRAVSF
jgi:hypothetical protein